MRRKFRRLTLWTQEQLHSLNTIWQARKKKTDDIKKRMEELEAQKTKHMQMAQQEIRRKPARFSFGLHKLRKSKSKP